MTKTRLLYCDNIFLLFHNKGIYYVDASFWTDIYNNSTVFFYVYRFISLIFGVLFANITQCFIGFTGLWETGSPRRSLNNSLKALTEVSSFRNKYQLLFRCSVQSVSRHGSIMRKITRSMNAHWITVFKEINRIIPTKKSDRLEQNAYLHRYYRYFSRE